MTYSPQEIEDIRTKIFKMTPAEQEGILPLFEEILKEEKKERSQGSFMEFVRSVWSGFIWGRHHEIMAEAFEDIANGKVKRLIINMPPRHTKSEFASYLLPAWFLGKYPEKKINDIILTTVENYLKYIVNSNQDRSHRIIIQGVPCPNIDIKRHEEKDIKKLVEVIALFNYQLKTLSKKSGFGFLDVYKLTNRGDGISNKIWHIDAIHLSPQGLREAWSNYAEYPSLDFCQQD